MKHTSSRIRETLAGILKAAVVTFKKKKTRKGSRDGNASRYRKRHSVADIYNVLGPVYFRRAYRMTYETFLDLYDSLEESLNEVIGSNTDNYRYAHNGPISNSVRLACAIRYFAGGSPYDIMCKYGISHTDVFRSVWFVVEAVNKVDEFRIEYPSSHEQQQKIAKGFQQLSGAGFPMCAGAIDGVLIWTHCPSLYASMLSGVGIIKYLCARKGKYGSNCQATCDSGNRFLDISTTYPGSTSDCLAFEGSALFSILEDGLLCLATTCM